MRIKTSWIGTAVLAGSVFGVVPAAPMRAAEDDAVKVSLKSPLLICHEQAGGVRPPDVKGAEAEHDLIFFVIAGRDADNKEIRTALPKDGSHLKLDTKRASSFVKNAPVWDGMLRSGQKVTFLISVREQDGHDSAAEDEKEAAGCAAKVDHATPLKQLARIPVHEILHGEKGENDHVGTIAVRIANEKGKIVFETEPGADAKYLKGHTSDDPTRRVFELRGDHSHYDLHLAIESR